MIEVNLIPSGRKRPPGPRRFALSLPSIGGLPREPWVLGAIPFCLVAAGVMGWLFLSVEARKEEVEVALEAALQDSARYSDLIARTNVLMARRDSIVERAAIIRDIDQDRYVWPHILDEIARALPDYTWLLQVQQVAGGRTPRIRIVGESGSIQALTIFMDQLEASAFLRGVTFMGSSQVVRQPENQLVHRFDLEVDYEHAPLDLLETVPLLGGPFAGAGAAPPGP